MAEKVLLVTVDFLQKDSWPASDVQEELNCDCHDAAPFNFGCDQTHGLITHRSDGYQEHDVHLIEGELLGHSWCSLPD